MKFFKHFVDAHRGSSLQILRQKYGMAAVGRYWTFVELCAEKMNKERDEEYTEHHTTFAFAKPYLTSSLGYANLKQASSYLEALAELGLCSTQDMGDVWACSMPKLLECIDRDAKRARPERGRAAPKNKNQEKEKEIDKEGEKDKEKNAQSAPPPEPFFQKRFNPKDLPTVGEIWNSGCSPLTKITMTTRTWNVRSDVLLADYGPEEIRRAVALVSSNAFLTGANRRKWKATFAWFINAENFGKVLNGDYNSESGVESMLEQLKKELEAS